MKSDANISMMGSTFLKKYLKVLMLFSISMCFSIPMCSQEKKAFLVGISNYSSNEKETSEDSWSNIHGTNDVELISKTLQKQKFNVTKLLNKDATASRIRKDLSVFVSSCKEGDVVYIHFSCHGQPVEDIDGDEKDGWDESIIPIDACKIYVRGKYSGENHIVDDELNKYVNIARKKVGINGIVYVVIDACHAGTSYRGDEDDSVFVRGTNKGFSSSGKLFAPRLDKRGMYKIEKKPKMSDICLLEACRSYQVNNEIREGGTYYGSLSFYINKALSDMELSKDTSWIKKVNQMMNSDIRLIRQNMVVETSK